MEFDDDQFQKMIDSLNKSYAKLQREGRGRFEEANLQQYRVEDCPSVENLLAVSKKKCFNSRVSLNNTIDEASNHKNEGSDIKKQVNAAINNNEDRWTHDRFDDIEQRPKTTDELIAIYGYDIHESKCPPRGMKNYYHDRTERSYYFQQKTSTDVVKASSFFKAKEERKFSRLPRECVHTDLRSKLENVKIQKVHDSETMFNNNNNDKVDNYNTINEMTMKKRENMRIDNQLYSGNDCAEAMSKPQNLGNRQMNEQLVTSDDKDNLQTKVVQTDSGEIRNLFVRPWKKQINSMELQQLSMSQSKPRVNDDLSGSQSPEKKTKSPPAVDSKIILQNMRKPKFTASSLK